MAVVGMRQDVLTPQTTAELIRDQVLLGIDPVVAVRLSAADLTERIDRMIAQIADNQRLLLNMSEQQALAAELVNDMIGLGPLESLLADETVSDILVNGPTKVFVERRGKMELTGVTFRNDAHVMHVAQRIASTVGRRIDESSPMLDARLLDGSRVNVLIPPLSLNGPCLSIRKFSRSVMTFERYAQIGTVSPNLGRVLEIAARCRLNIIVSGGTGSGKTTVLNALSRMIDADERIVTIEDAAELQMQQPHVVSLETRPANIEGQGEVTQRDLVRNALRMRPDRIIVGEVRGSEAFDMMQAMNTGHNGSMSTVHANSARDALSRIDNMILMASGNLPMLAIRGQIASAIDLVIQTERMRDGVRRITEVVEVVGMEGDIITLNPVFSFVHTGQGPDGRLSGTFVPHPSQPRFMPRLEYFGLGAAFMKALGPDVAKP
jgi:pilus assembly protein CpaF